ncbi:MAG: NAD-binding protein [Spirochaetaceae bacterium]|jgi:trk system potassium uptake protein TrkA|nr:NAD-binding protein [Spirochaetaceae bacterium]GMO21702.1 MAG: Trk system potassium transporter TrkA [Termitinemataceae bacterium]
MKVIIVGAGKVGTALAMQLSRTHNDVSIIESNEERARHISNRLDCMVLHDEGNSIEALHRAMIKKSDALVCVTGNDEINIIICALAAGLNPRLIKIACVRNEEYVQYIANAKDGAFGVDFFVHPNIEASRTALNAIEHDAAGNVLAFAGTRYELSAIEVAGGSAFDGLLLKNYRNLVQGETLVALVERQNECILPSGTTVLAAGDRVHILAAGDELELLFELGGRKEGVIRKIGVAGGGQIGSLIVEGLLTHEKDNRTSKLDSFFSFFKGFILKRNRKVMLIERDYSICKELSARFPEAIVLNEDISDESFVFEERLNGLDLIVTATGNQELNIIAALYLKQNGVRRALAMVASDGYAAIARRLGIDVVIPIKSVIVDSILSKLSGARSIHRLGDGSIAVLELEVKENAPVANIPITEFKFENNALVMLASRAGESFIPRGNYVFKPGDHVIISARHSIEKEIEKRFAIELPDD